MKLVQITKGIFVNPDDVKAIEDDAYGSAVVLLKTGERYNCARQKPSDIANVLMGKQEYKERENPAETP